MSPDTSLGDTSARRHSMKSKSHHKRAKSHAPFGFGEAAKFSEFAMCGVDAPAPKDFVLLKILVANMPHSLVTCSKAKSNCSLASRS